MVIELIPQKFSIMPEGQLRDMAPQDVARSSGLPEFLSIEKRLPRCSYRDWTVR